MKKKLFLCFVFSNLFLLFAYTKNDFYYSCFINDKNSVQNILNDKTIDINHSLDKDEVSDLFRYVAEKENVSISEDDLKNIKDINICPLTLSLLNYENEKDSLDTFYYLVSIGANVNIKFHKDAYLYPSLHILFKDNLEEFYKISEAFLKNGLDPNFIDNNGATNFFYVLSMENLKLIELFLKNGANVNLCAIQSTGMYPLMGAISSGNLDFVNLLLKYKADISVHDNDGVSVFMYACKTQSLELVKKFYSQKVLNETDNDGWTPLMYATVEGNMQIVDYLVQMGADINAKDKDNKPVLGHTMQGNYDLKKYLISKGAIVTEEYVLGYFKACPEETKVCNLLLPYVKTETLDYRRARMDQYEKGTPVTVTFKCTDIDKKEDYYKVTGYMNDGSNNRRIFILFYERPAFLEYDIVSATVIFNELTDYLGNEIPSFSFVCLN